MEHNSDTEKEKDPTPPDCFRLEEIQAFKEKEGQALVEVNYYYWIGPNPAEHRFVAFIELLFGNDDALILSSGEDSEAITVTDALSLIQRAKELQAQNQGQVSIQRVPVHTSYLWENLMEQPLASIQLSKNEAGLYLNDALLLDFESAGSVVIGLHERGGLAVQRG